MGLVVFWVSILEAAQLDLLDIRHVLLQLPQPERRNHPVRASLNDPQASLNNPQPVTFSSSYFSHCLCFCGGVGGSWTAGVLRGQGAK